MRDRVLFAIVAGADLIASVGLLGYTFGTSMARFDSGAPLTLVQTIAEWLLAILIFPVLTVVGQLATLHFHGVWGWLPFAANASLWGVAAIVIRRWIRRT